MCGIAGVFHPAGAVPLLDERLALMNELQQHRGPDGHGMWAHPLRHVGFAHRRLSIIDVAPTGAQPMSDGEGNWITYNGEIYNYLELRRELGEESFRSHSDTEVILRAYRRWGTDCLSRLRGMFAFAIWDEQQQMLFCARDRFGIKPFYYAECDGAFHFASEIKALLPFLPDIETDPDGLFDYLTFQFCLAGKSLFKNVRELPPAHFMTITANRTRVDRYWEVHYDLDWNHTERYFSERLLELFDDSIDLHLRADVPVGAYVSGGFDSGISASLAARRAGSRLQGFTGRFLEGEEYDESRYARDLAAFHDFELHEVAITAGDFADNIRKVIYHLDYPVAGPGSFPQYMVSQLASRHRKVVIGGQGGDEIFGGYARYLIAYFEQCIKAAIDGTANNGNFVVTYESIIPNLVSLRQYKPLLQEFWRDGMFEELDRRYFRLVDRAPTLSDEVNWQELNGSYSPYETFRRIFVADNVRKESYFDSMTHFDFKTLLPALLQVEDRMSMAHGLESRVPFIDHPLVEFAATIPSNVKFKDGTMKHILKKTMGHVLPDSIRNRTDKMGFPVPLHDWVKGSLREFVLDVFTSTSARTRAYVNNDVIAMKLDQEPKFGRKIWGLLCLELWQQEFHDQASRYRSLLLKESVR
jgi:asparagine synthase (glutamine-hydrolysing)